MHAVFRDMPVHDDALMGAFVDGLLPKDPLKDISAKQQQARITAFLPYLKSFAERLEIEKQARDMEDAQGADAADRTRKRTYILVDCDNVGLEQLKNMLANYTSFGQCLFDCTLPG